MIRQIESQLPPYLNQVLVPGSGYKDLEEGRDYVKKKCKVGQNVGEIVLFATQRSPITKGRIIHFYVFVESEIRAIDVIKMELWSGRRLSELNSEFNQQNVVAFDEQYSGTYWRIKADKEGKYRIQLKLFSGGKRINDSKNKPFLLELTLDCVSENQSLADLHKQNSKIGDNAGNEASNQYLVYDFSPFVFQRFKRNGKGNIEKYPSRNHRMIVFAILYFNLLNVKIGEDNRNKIDLHLDDFINSVNNHGLGDGENKVSYAKSIKQHFDENYGICNLSPKLVCKFLYPNFNYEEEQIISDDITNINNKKSVVIDCINILRIPALSVGVLYKLLDKYDSFESTKPITYLPGIDQTHTIYKNYKKLDSYTNDLDKFVTNFTNWYNSW